MQFRSSPSAHHCQIQKCPEFPQSQPHFTMAAVQSTSPGSTMTRQSPELDPVIIIKRLSDSRKAQVPYYTGWDSKPNACLKLVADIESEDNYRRKLVLARACNVIESGEQRRRYSEDDGKNRKAKLQRKSSPNSPKQHQQQINSKEVAAIPPRSIIKKGTAPAQPQSFEDYIQNRRKENYDHYRDFPDLPDDEDTSFSLHCYDSSVNTTTSNQSFHSVSLSPHSFGQLNISDIKSDSSQGGSAPVRNKSKSSLKSALSSSTPLKSSSTTKHVRFEEDSETKNVSNRTGTFSILEDEEYDEYDSYEEPSASGQRSRNTKKESPPSLHIQSPVHVQIQRALSEYETERIRKWRDDVEAKAVELSGYEDKVDSPLKKADDTHDTPDKSQDLKSLIARCDARRQKLRASLEHQQKLRQLELDQEDKQIEATKQFEAEKRKAELEKEQADAEVAALAAAQLRETEERQKQKQEEEAQLRAKEAAAAAETQRVQDEIQLQEQELQRLREQTEQRAPVNTAIANEGVPPEFRRAVLQADLLVYAKLQQRLEEIKEAVKDISSSNPRTKEFYFTAMKVINTPINSISNLSADHLHQKILHFIQLLEGKPVYIGDSMRKPFVASGEQNGEIFVQNLLAFRFVKKSEAEITRGMSGLAPLANLGVQLIRRFPGLGILIRANFYKMCPFLVPLIYPRPENMTNEQYAATLGHEQLGGTERTIQQVLLERISGYCTLYGLMVNIVEKGQFSDLQAENIEFFSLKEIWRILAATLKLEPQVDVTCTVLHALLETSCDGLYRVFRSQFRKLMNELSSKYLRKIRNITPPAQAASLTRLELLLEAQVPKLR